MALMSSIQKCIMSLETAETHNTTKLQINFDTNEYKINK